MHVSYQLSGLNSSGLSEVNTPPEMFVLLSYRLIQGALIHFSEEAVTNFTPPSRCLIGIIFDLLITLLASTPWIALIACDENATNASMDEDIFTLAHDKGAVSAASTCLTLLYCVT